MKKFISISLFISACFLGSCSSYDDERIWQDLNEIEKTIGDYEAQTETLTAQMASLSKVLGSSFITLISQDADGNYIISYSDGGGETHTVTIATQGDVIKFQSSQQSKIVTVNSTGHRLLIRGRLTHSSLTVTERNSRLAERCLTLK